MGGWTKVVIGACCAAILSQRSQAAPDAPPRKGAEKTGAKTSEKSGVIPESNVKPHFTIPPTDFPADNDYQGDWWPYLLAPNHSAKMETADALKTAVVCTDHLSEEVCAQCSPCVECAKGNFSLPGDRVCFDLYLTCLGRAMRAKAEADGVPFQRKYITVPALAHFSGKTGLCTNHPYFKSATDDSPPQYGGLRGYTFDFEAEFAMQFSSIMDAYIKINLLQPLTTCPLATSLGTDGINLPFIAAVGYQLTQSLARDDPRISPRSHTCFNVSPQIPVVCQYRVTGDGDAFIECPAAHVFEAIGELQPGDQITIVIETHMMCGLDKEPVNLPPPIGWEMDILRSAYLAIGSNAKLVTESGVGPEFPVCLFYPDEVDGGLAGALFEPILATQMTRHSWIHGTDEEECGELGGRLVGTQEELDKLYSHNCDIKQRRCGCLQSVYRRTHSPRGLDPNAYCVD